MPRQLLIRVRQAILSPVVLLSVVLAIGAQASGQSLGDSAAKASGSFSVQFTYDGPRPDVKKLPVTHDMEIYGTEVVDESLVVGAAGELANVITYVTNADIPVHPELKQQAEQPVELAYRGTGIRPRILPIVVSQQLQVLNDTAAPINFHWALRANPPVNVLVPAKGTWKGTTQKAERLPIPVRDGVHPWLVAYLLPLTHPYAAVSGEDGIARLTHLPEGTWTFRFWHEKGGFLKSESGESEFELTIEPGENRRTLRVSPQFIVSLAAASAADPSAIGANQEPTEPSPVAGPSTGRSGALMIESFIPPPTADELRRHGTEVEQRISQLMERLRQVAPESDNAARLKQELRTAVSEAFFTRQQLQRAQLAEFARRLETIERTLAERDQLSQQIIEQRMRELLHQVGGDSRLAALQEVHDLCAERTQLRIYHRDGHPRLTEIEQRLGDLHEGPLAELQTVASDASLACSEEPMYGQRSYGIILYATAVEDIAENELLLYHADRVYRGTAYPKLTTTGEGWYFRPQVAVPKGTHFVVACIQDAPEELERVRQGFMPNSDRARDPGRPYQTQIYRPDGKPLVPGP